MCVISVCSASAVEAMAATATAAARAATRRHLPRLTCRRTTRQPPTPHTTASNDVQAALQPTSSKVCTPCPPSCGNRLGRLLRHPAGDRNIPALPGRAPVLPGRCQRSRVGRRPSVACRGLRAVAQPDGSERDAAIGSTLEPRPRRARRQRSTGARYLTNVGVILPGACCGADRVCLRRRARRGLRSRGRRGWLRHRARAENPPRGAATDPRPNAGSRSGGSAASWWSRPLSADRDSGCNGYGSPQG